MGIRSDWEEMGIKLHGWIWGPWSDLYESHGWMDGWIWAPCSNLYEFKKWVCNGNAIWLEGAGMQILKPRCDVLRVCLGNYLSYFGHLRFVFCGQLVSVKGMGIGRIQMVVSVFWHLRRGKLQQIWPFHSCWIPEHRHKTSPNCFGFLFSYYHFFFHSWFNLSSQ